MKKEFRSFKDARKFARLLKLKKWSDWSDFCKSGNKPNDIPSNVNVVYKNDGWVSWGDFLGTDNISPTTMSKNYLPFNEARDKARELAKKYNIKSWEDWRKAVRERKIPKNIPLKPDRVYAKKRKR